MKYKKLFFTIALVSMNAIAMAQAGWVLKCEKDGIKVYTIELDSSSLKAVTASCILTTSITTVTDMPVNINNSREWRYAAK